MKYVVVDIGGTDIKYGLAEQSGVLLHSGKMPSCLTTGGAASLADRVAAVVLQYRREHDVAGVALATTGVVNTDSGVIAWAGSHLPGYAGLPLTDEVSRRCGVPCSAENDVNAAAYGEYWRGAAQGAASLFCMAVGTGIGGALLQYGQLWRGVAGSAGEIGLLRHGSRETFEERAAVPALLRRATAAGCAVRDGKALFAAAAAGDERAAAVIRGGIDCWAEEIANICWLLNPAVVVLGGAVMAQRDYLEPRLVRQLQRLVDPYILARTSLRFAALGNTAAMIGALYHFLQTEEGGANGKT